MENTTRLRRAIWRYKVARIALVLLFGVCALLLMWINHFGRISNSMFLIALLTASASSGYAYHHLSLALDFTMAMYDQLHKDNTQKKKE